PPAFAGHRGGRLMELALASAIGVLVFAGVYLLLRARSFDVILGLTLLSYATNLLIFSSGRLVSGKPPVLKPGLEADLANYTDPVDAEEPIAREQQERELLVRERQQQKGDRP